MSPRAAGRPRAVSCPVGVAAGSARPARLHHVVLSRAGLAGLRWRTRRAATAVRSVLLRGVDVEAAAVAPTVHAYCTDEARAPLSAHGFGCGPYDGRSGGAVRWLDDGRFVGRGGEEYLSLARLQLPGPSPWHGGGRPC